MTDAPRSLADEIGDDAPTSTPKVDVASLVAGIVVLALAAAFAFGDLDRLDVQTRVVWPTVLLGVGVALLLGGRRR